MSAWITLALDLVILTALGATIFHALRLSRQFQQMQVDRKAFETLIAALNVASSRAEAAIQSLKTTSIESGDRLQEKINRARALAEELEIIVQAGDSLAGRLESLAEKSRKSTTSTAAPAEMADSPAAAEKTALQPRSRAEKDLLDAIKAKQTS